MAKKEKATANTEAQGEAQAEPMVEVITGTLVLQSVEVDEEGVAVDTKTLTISKGKRNDKTRYLAACDGATSKESASITAAINDLLENGLKVLPKLWAVPKNEKEVKFPERGDNKPKEPESIDDLPPETADNMRSGMADLASDVAEYRAAEERTVEVVRKVATRLRDLRAMYNKAEWSIFAKLAPANSEVAKLLTAKNTLGEFVFFANIPEALADLMPSEYRSPKAAQRWINGIRSNVAGVIVDYIKANDKAFGEMGATEAVQTVIDEHWNGENKLAFDSQEAADVMLEMHVKAWPTGLLFDVLADGSLAPAREAETKKHVTASRFGSEGADELVKALAQAFNAWKSPEAKAAVADMRDRAKAVVSADFNKLSPDAVALHLFRILAGRIDAETDESLEVTTGDCLTAVDKLGGWLEAVRSGTMTVADVLAPAEGKPTSEDEAEDDADAEA